MTVAKCPNQGPVKGAPPRSPSAIFSDPVLQSDQPPPPISGGTLLTSADGSTLIAANSDRDLVYVVDITKRELSRRVELSPGDEPGRLAQDKAGTVHVALRGGRGVASFALGADAPVRRRELCDLPRGLAYDRTSDRLYWACAEGALVQLDPSTGTATKQFELGRDLRDVVVREGRLFVTRFRSAEVLEVDPKDGRIIATSKTERFPEEEVLGFEDVPIPAATPDARPTLRRDVIKKTNLRSSHIAWRTIDVAGRGLVMLHQRALDSEIELSSLASGGYGGSGFPCGPGLVHGAVTVGDSGSVSADLSGAGLFVDIAADPSTRRNTR